jgi:phenylacetate-CoA ligase
MANLTPWLELPKIIALHHRDRAAMEGYQERQLMRLVEDLYSGNEFYRRHWNDAGFKLREFKGREDLTMLPLVTKQQARGMAQAFRDKDPDGIGLIRHKTSGTSGEPFEVIRNWHEERFLTAIRTWVLRSLGFRARLRQARIRIPADFDWLNDRPLRMLNRLCLYRSRIFSCFDAPDFTWQQLAAYQPDVIMGYSEAVARVARYGIESRFSNLNPKLVLLGGELCTPLMCRQISEAFRVPVFQTYASTEFNLVAWSCPTGSLLHICDPTVIVEVLDEDGNSVAAGETGRAVVTALHSRTMPLVRFILGDQVVKGPTPCPCGAPYSTLQSIDGREMDRLKLINGKSLHAFVLLNEMIQHDTSWMRQYQLVQNEPGVIELRIAHLHRPDSSFLEFLTGRLEKFTAGTVVHIKLVEEMTLDQNGKFHLCKCNLK